MQVNADVRTIVSKTFASDYSLRFPRVTRMRLDKGAADATSTAELRDLVASNKGMLTGGCLLGRLAEPCSMVVAWSDAKQQCHVSMCMAGRYLQGDYLQGD